MYLNYFPIFCVYLTCLLNNQDLIFSGVFLVDENSKYNVISLIGTSFRSFRHTLTKKYILL